MPAETTADSNIPLRPNVPFGLADNLGWGELGCYGGGALRTRRFRPARRTTTIP